ncbi:MAG: hypothetical protein CMF23_15520 [Ignavibacteriae bacterium]|nr:hypothetical protein [Ignavibacteriota bacterium]
MTQIFNTLFLIATIISAIGIIYIIYSRSIAEISRKLFVLTLLLVIGYLISHFVHFIIMPSEDVTILDQSCHSFLLLIILVLTFFSYYFHSSKDMSFPLKLFLIVPSAALILLLWSGYLVESSHVHTKKLEAHYSPYYAGYLVWYVLLLSLSIYFLVKKAIISKSNQIRKQIFTVLIGLIITNLTAFVFGLYLPWILGFYYLVEISPLAFFIGVILTTAIAISRFDLFPTAISKIQSFSLNKKIIFSAVIVVPVIILLIQIPLGRILFDIQTGEQWEHYFFISLFGGIIVSTAMAFMITKLIANPLNKLIEKTTEIRRGNYGTVVDIYSNDELGKLAATFNEMSKTLIIDSVELELKQNRIEMLLNAFEKSNAAICVLNLSGKIIELNTEFSNILKISKANLYNSIIFKIIEPATNLKELTEVLQKFNGKNKLEEEISIQFDEEIKNYLITMSPFYIDEAKPAGYLLIAIDTTDLKKLESQLAHSEKLAALGKMAAILTHEIKTPLTSIKMNSDMLAESLVLNEDDASSMNIIKKEINRLNNLVKEVLLFAKQMNLNKEQFDIKELIEEIIGNYKAKFADKNFKVIYDGKSAEIYADKEKLHQVFLNLIQNSYESVEENGELKIDSVVDKSKDGRILFKLMDNGLGIPEDMKKKIFEPFYTTKSSGTGLGLAVARKIIELHNGTIELVSSRKGETIFQIELLIKNNDNGKNTSN